MAGCRSQQRCNNSNVVINKSNHILSRISASRSTITNNKQKASDTNEEKESEEEQSEAEVPQIKRTKYIPAETYDGLHIRYLESKSQNEELLAENLELKHQLAQSTSKIAAYEGLQASFTKLHKKFMTIYKPTVEEKLLKPPRIITFNGREFQTSPSQLIGKTKTLSERKHNQKK